MDKFLVGSVAVILGILFFAILISLGALFTQFVVNFAAEQFHNSFRMTFLQALAVNLLLSMLRGILFIGRGKS